MSFTLVIVESPAKCQKIEKYLGKAYRVIGSFGHITHLSNLDQIDFNNNFKPNFQLIESKKSQIDKIKRLIKQSNDVILATDDDREGEAIAWHICQQFHLDVLTTKRIVFHEITEKAIQNAVNNPGKLNLDLVNAQQGRQILDLIVGFKITPILWKHIMSNSKKSLSAGRCQTPALRLVYDNYKEIEKSPGKMQFNTNSTFFDKLIIFQLNNSHDTNEAIEQFLNLSKEFNHTFIREEERETIKTPPQPFTTSSLQQSANNNMNISPKDTMSLAQVLYEAGYITYMRTDSKIYSKEFIDKTREYITKKYTEKFIHLEIDKFSETQAKTPKKKTKKTKEEQNNAQEAHEAIRPTNIEVVQLPDDEDIFTPKHRKLYKLIWSNTLESLMAPAKYTQIVCKISAPLNLYYRYTTELNIFEGWKIVQGVESDKFYNYLKTIQLGIIPYKIINSKQSLRELKNHYNEAKLVQLLEERGIGRPSTFSSLIEKIQEREYVKRQDIKGRSIKCYDYTLENNVVIKKENEREFGNEKNKLVITQIGIFVIEFLIKYYDKLFDYEYTKIMENQLDSIAKGIKTYSDLCKECLAFIEQLNKDNNIETVYKERLNIKIDEKHTYLIGKNGPTIKYKGETGDAFYSVKSEIDIERLKMGEYKIEDIIDTNIKELGIYKEHPIYLKLGQYGAYLDWSNIKKSLKYVKINIPHDKITLNDAINIFENSISGENGLIRQLNKDLSIRKGKYGDYIFYKTETMRNPQFLKLNGFDGDYINCNNNDICDWVRTKYKIVINK